MPSLRLKAIAGPRSASFPALAALCSALAPGALCITDLDSKPFLGNIAEEFLSTHTRVPVTVDDEPIGFVIGPATAAGPVALLLTHLAAREREGRALAAEVQRFPSQRSPELTHPGDSVNISEDSIDLGASHRARIHPVALERSEWNEVIFPLNRIEFRQER
jgi:hypothetical protein